MVTALIFAGGTGQRMNSGEVPKQFLKVDGKPIIIRTAEYFSLHSQVDEIVIVCLESWMGELERELSEYRIRKVKKILPGGSTGYQSIHKGLVYIGERAERRRECVSAGEEEAGKDLVLICDGVRPMLSEDLLSRCIAQAREYGTAVPVTPSIDSVLESRDGSLCRKNFDRKQIYITQAPQGFWLKRILAAHGEAERRGIEAVSSGELLLALGQEIHIFQGIRENIKVTTPEDLNALRAAHYYEHFKDFAKEEWSGQECVSVSCRE